MSQDRFCGLALLNIHRGNNFSVNNIIERFGNSTH